MTTEIIRINEWDINLNTGEMHHSASTEAELNDGARLDPLCSQLLRVLVEHEGELVSKAFLMETLWPTTYVNEDALARYVSRLRKAIGDQPKNPAFIETLPKRGYRLVANSVTRLYPQPEPQPDQSSQSATRGRRDYYPYLYALGIIVLITAVLVSVYSFSVNEHAESPSQVGELLSQADIYYHQVNRKDNEMAYSLYQQALAQKPNSAWALSGMANALVQKAIRYTPENNATTWRDMSLKKALRDDRLSRDQARQFLSRALVFANKAVDLAPNMARGHKAKGFVLSAQGLLDEALKSHQRALSINPAAWDVLINIGEIHDIQNLPLDAIAYYKKAFDAMGQYPFEQANPGRAWRAEMGVSIGTKYLELNNLNDAEIWYRHVLAFAPFHTEATRQLALILESTNRFNESQRLCQAYSERIGESVCSAR